MKHLLTIIMIAWYGSTTAQPYILESYPEEYEEITENYTSMQFEELGFPSWAKRIDFPFDFPFFDDTLDHIIFDQRHIWWTDSVDFYYNIYNLSTFYEWDPVWDTSNISSDVRYRFTERDGMQAFVAQWTKMRVYREPQIDYELYDCHVDFQTWLFEDGTIEHRFGSSSLEPCDNYEDGIGFFRITTLDDTLINGTDTFVLTPGDTIPTSNFGLYSIDESQEIEWVGPYDNLLEVPLEDAGIITVFPPNNWVIRLRRNTVSTAEENLEESLTVYPNPAIDGSIRVSSEGPISEYAIYNNQAQIFMQGKDLPPDQPIDVSGLSSGYYFIKLVVEGEIRVRTFVVP